MPKFLTNEEKSEILLKSDRYTARQLAEQYGCSRSMILKIWMENNYHKPKSFNYYVNNQYFNTIDSPIKAYALGLIASDGNLYKRNSQQGQIKIYLEKTDEEVLRLILKDMGSTHPIKYSKHNDTLECGFTIVSQEIFDNLTTIGIGTNKTWEMDLNKILDNIPFIYYNDFIRGYFDGDGCISHTENKLPSKISVSIAMPLKTGEQIKSILNRIGIECSIYIDKHRNYKYDFCSVEFFGKNKYIFLKYLYENNCICMERKFKRALQYFYLIENNTSNRKENSIAIDEYNIFCNNLKLNDN